jgi:sugar phosphate permease
MRASVTAPPNRKIDLLLVMVALLIITVTVPVLMGPADKDVKRLFLLGALILLPAALLGLLQRRFGPRTIEGLARRD